jgi:hypothetical protein
MVEVQITLAAGPRNQIQKRVNLSPRLACFAFEIFLAGRALISYASVRASEKDRHLRGLQVMSIGLDRSWRITV